MNNPMQPWKSFASSVEVGTFTDGWNLAEPPAEGSEDRRVFRFTVFFASPFDAPPLVHLALTGFDLDQRDSERLSLRHVDVNSSSFVAEIATWRETRVYSVEFSWLALGG